MSIELHGRTDRIWPLVLIAVVLGSTSFCVAILRGQAGVGAEASAAVEVATTFVQHVAFLIIMTLFVWHQRRVLAFLVKLAVRNWAIGAEIVLLLAIVYGAFGSYGVPELFWDDSTLTVGIAAFSAMVFLELAWFAIYLVDYTRPNRRRQRRLEWSRLEPIVMDSGLQRFLTMPTQNVAPHSQVGWFLLIACLPGLFLLAVPAFLPAIRPSSDPRVVEWTWLAGLAMGALVPSILLLTRPMSSLIGKLRSWLGKPQAPDRTNTFLHRPGVLLFLLASVYLGTLIVDRLQPAWVVPAALFCLLLAMIAVAVAFFLSFHRRAAQVWIAIAVLATILLNGIQTYDPCYRGLGAYYPADPLRRLIGLPSPFSTSDGSRPVNLVDYQEKEIRRASREAAVQSRIDILNAWKSSLEHSTGSGNPAATKPILVAVATSGGALRAGVWTAAVLDVVSKELPEFPRHVRFVTGASGGMVGAALFVASQVPSTAPAGCRQHHRA